MTKNNHQSNKIISLAEYVQKKKSRVKQTEEFVEKLSLFLPSQPGHSKLELELASNRYIGLLNGNDYYDVGWTDYVFCYLGVPDYVEDQYEIDLLPYHLEVPFSLLWQLSTITGKNYHFSICYIRQRDEKIFIHTNVQEFISEGADFEKEIMDKLEPWDEDNEKFVDKYITNALQNAEEKKEQIIYKIINMRENELRYRMVYMPIAIFDLAQKKRGQLTSQKTVLGYDDLKKLEVGDLWEIGINNDEDGIFLKLFRDIIEYEECLVRELSLPNFHEVSHWEQMTEYDRSNLREIARTVLTNSEVEFDYFDENEA